MIVELARVAYDAWWREAGEHVGPIVPWDELPNGIKNAWNAALEAAFDASSSVGREKPPVTIGDDRKFAVTILFDNEDYDLLIEAVKASGLELCSMWILKVITQALHTPPAPPGWGQEG